MRLGADAGIRQSVVVPEQSIDAGRHVLRPRDRRDPLPARFGEMVDGARGAGAVVDVHVREPVGRRPSAHDDRDAVAPERGRQRVGAVERVA